MTMHIEWLCTQCEAEKDLQVGQCSEHPDARVVKRRVVTTSGLRETDFEHGGE